MNQTNVSSRNRRNANDPSRPAFARCGAVLLGVYISFASLGNLALAGPEGGQVVSGAGTITQSGPNTLINQGSQRLGLEWQTFNVGANESVVFDQPSSSAVALNRIFDQNPSQILGALDANGHVYLINPNGIVFGDSAVINVGALLASSLDISINDFMSGDLNFEALGGDAGLVVNRGLITAATGGHVTLLGGSVANEGLIVADLGQVNLGAGASASLDFDGDGLLFFEIDDAALANNAQLESAVSNSGEIRADGGQVVLSAKAAQDVFANVVNNQGVIRANRIDDSGGVVRLVGAGGTVLSSGTLDASGDGGAGGTVQVLGDRVGLFGDAVVDVSGDTNGGLAQIGGSFQGSDPSIANSNRTFVGSDVTINADAGNVGDGGEVIVWADEVARFYGEVSARGGAVSGNGGFVETSGKSLLEFAGTVNASASNGASGTWLLDPVNVEIAAVGQMNITPTGANPMTFAPTTAPAPGGVNTTVINVANIVGALDGGTSVVITTTALAGEPDATEAGDITVNAAIGKTAGTGALLTLNADNDIIVNQSISSTSGVLVVDLNAAGDVVIDAPITTNNGAFNSDGVNFMQNQAINTGTGAVDVNHTGVVVVAAQIQTMGGAVDIDGSSIDTSGNLINTTGGADAAGGAVVLTATGQLMTGSITTTGGAASGIGQNAGNVDLSGDDVSIGVITATGSDGDAGGNNNGGAGGTVTATAQGDLILNGNIDSSGGAAGGTGTTGADGALTLLVGQGAAGTATVNAGVALAGGARTLTGGANVDAFDLSADFAGTVNGAGGNDIFGINVAQSGTVNGGAGADVFNLNDNVTGTVDGGAGGDTFNLTDGVAVGTLTGGAGSDTLVSVDVGNTANTWVVNGVNQGTLNGQAFQAIENLTGNGQVDTFTFTADLAGNALGLANDDVFNVNTGGAAGLFDGGANSDTLSYAGQAGPVTIPLNTLTNIETLIGTGGADTLQGTAGIDTFTTNNVNAGTVAGVAYSSFENLSGLGGGDIFNLGHNVTGTVDGGAGGDTFNLTDGVAVGTLTGGANGDTLVSVDVGNTANTWVVNAANQGTLNGQAFTAIENLTGNAEIDTFTFTAALAGNALGLANDDVFNVNTGGAAGLFDGGAGSDTLSYAGQAGPITIAVNTLTNMETLIGTAFADTLQGTAGVDTFTTNGVDAGTLVGVIDYQSFENLQGLGSADVFNLNDNVTGTVDGGADGDTFNLLDGVTVGTLTGGAGGADSDTLVSIDVGNTANAWVVDNPDAGNLNGQAFNDIESLSGNAQSDTFTFTAALSGPVQGFGGDDVFNLDADIGGFLTAGAGDDQINVNVSQSGALGGGADDDTFNLAANVSANVSGDAGTDTIVVDSATAAAFVVNNADEGDIDTGTGLVSFSNVGNLVGSNVADSFDIGANLSGTASGGDGDDSYTLAAGVSATIAAGAGTDSLAGSNSATTFTVNALNQGAADSAGGSVGFSSMETLTGGSAGDTFVMNADLSGMASGNAGNDTFDINANVTVDLLGGANDDEFILADGVTASGAVDGGAGNGDVLDFSEYTTARNVTLQGVGPNGFDGDEAALGSGFQNMNEIRGASSPSNSVRALDQNANWQIGGNVGNSYTPAGGTLAFDGSFDSVIAGSGVDSFILGPGAQTGDLTLDGGAGTDSAIVGGNFDVAGTLVMSSIESLARGGGGTLSAIALRITGATGGIGSVNAPVATNLGTLEVLASGGGLYLVEANGLNVLGAAIGSSDAEINVMDGDLTIGLINAGAADSTGGTVVLVVDSGDLLSGNALSEINISGGSARLEALLGGIGEANNPIVIEVDENQQITLKSGLDAFIRNLNLATVDRTGVGGTFSDAIRNATAASAGASAASSLSDVTAIDWDALEIVEIVDTLEPPVRLPADQQFDDDEFAQLRDANKLLLIRTSDGWKLIPVYVEATTAAN